MSNPFTEEETGMANRYEKIQNVDRDMEHGHP